MRRALTAMDILYSVPKCQPGVGANREQIQGSQIVNIQLAVQI